ncbi:MAG: glycosyltransferase, partial [Nitrosopumilus sp.]|nr:glycosyltransferase [Nitrosopumilus sp.]
MKHLPLVSIIIVNYNGQFLLENCFKSLSEIKYPNTEIILLDNGSSDDSVEFIEKNYPKTKLIKLGKN